MIRTDDRKYQNQNWYSCEPSNDTGVFRFQEVMWTEQNVHPVEQ